MIEFIATALIELGVIGFLCVHLSRTNKKPSEETIRHIFKQGESSSIIRHDIATQHEFWVDNKQVTKEDFEEIKNSIRKS